MFRHIRVLERVRVTIVWALAMAGAVSSACDAASMAPSSRVPNGAWGGDHVAMTVADAATHLELDCAHGDISGALRLDGLQQFDAAGTFVREHGGPIRQDEVPDSRPARYSGSVTATTMVLTIRLSETNEAIGTFTLVLGATGRVVKCL